MKVLTILGTRPEIIRLSGIIPLLDRYADHVVVHTGQNYDDRLDAIFFRELELRAPDVHLGVRGSGFGEQAGQILARIEPVLQQHRPDRVLILGDTNSGLAAIVARRLGIPVYHMEAGNRCFDDRVPEEVNRRVIDHSSTVLMPYTQRSRENLVREGIPSERILVTGNPIREVLLRFAARIDASDALARLGVERGKFFLVTAHRAENVDRPARLAEILTGLRRIAEEHGFPVICSLHPRTRSQIQRRGLSTEMPGIQFIEPLGLFDFIALERAAVCLLSDSGTVQEEACILGIPNVTLREVTERPETVECGSNLLAGTEPDSVLHAVERVLSSPPEWQAPPEYLRTNVAETVCRIVLGYRIPDLAERERRELTIE
jgi:UDP-N-acetylglucosamine 2-epimerase (non-hydrolysing)